MSGGGPPAARRFARFLRDARPPDAARARARQAFADTIGVALAGSAEPVARAVQAAAAEEGGRERCRILGTPRTANAGWAALANGAAAHALDFDDMCFVSMAHPSAPLVPAALAAGEIAGASGAALLDAYVAGFEIEAVLGRALNPRHYARGWHCTSTIGTVGAAAAAARLLNLDEDAAAAALAVAASQASGLKENFGTMTKPFHAGMAARAGVESALLARAGLTASARAFEGPQGYLVAMAAERETFGDTLDDLGRRWEIVETGISVKLYPSCAGTHPALDALLDLRKRHGLTPESIDGVAIDVDETTPTVLIYERPASGLEGKFSLHFCAAAALAFGRVDVDTFDERSLRDPGVRALLPKIEMRVDPEIARGRPSLTQARVTVRLAGGREVSARADGARGYPDKPAGREELDAKFLACARRVLDERAAGRALDALHALDGLADARTLTALLAGAGPAA